MRRFCRIVLLGFIVAYLAALALLAIGTWGIFGAEPDPLSGVYLIPLGLPWVFLAGAAPEPARLWLAAGAPLVNIVILWVLCRLAAARTQAEKE